MRVFLYVTEGVYCGLHGIEAMVVTDDIQTYEDAREWACEMGCDLVNSYGIYDTEEEVEDEDWGEDLEIDWSTWKIREDVTLSTRELDRLCSQLGSDLFIEKYCEKEILW